MRYWWENINLLKPFKKNYMSTLPPIHVSYLLFWQDEVEFSYENAY